jgi:NAD(P)-dependent dehydrogenase (short-subunit alcohol dehydrogenase family)
LIFRFYSLSLYKESNMCKRLLDRNAIVTGAARGMGFAIAKALFNEGARVAIVDVDEKGATASMAGF